MVLGECWKERDREKERNEEGIERERKEEEDKEVLTNHRPLSDSKMFLCVRVTRPSNTVSLSLSHSLEHLRRFKSEKHLEQEVLLRERESSRSFED